MKKTVLKSVSAFLCALIALPTVFSFAENEVGTLSETEIISEQSEYERYLSENSFKPAEKEVSLECEKPTVQIEGRGAVLLEKGDEITLRLNSEQDSLYNIAVDFANYTDTCESYKISLKIDGQYPYENCSALHLHAVYEDDGGIRKLANGDEAAPAQKHTDGAVHETLTDSDGIVLDPYRFAFSAGEHTLTLTALDNAFYFLGVTLEKPEETLSYKTVSADYSDYNRYNGEPITFEAEKALYKNSYSLTARSDNGSASVSPNNPVRSVINYIGGSSWNGPGQEIAWEIDVPETALYSIGFIFKQSFVNGGDVYRLLKIDGKSPFKEAERIGFSYASKWQYTVLCDDDGNECMVLLEKGKHILSLSVTLADISNVFSELKPIVEELGSLYLDMTMITGENPDSNRDYELHKQIPEFTQTLADIQNRCETLYAKIGVSLKANGELRGALKNMSRIVSVMQESLYESHLQIPAYYTAYQTLSSWLYDIKNMSLSLDRIILTAPERESDVSLAGFFESFKFSVLRYLNSYVNDYSRVENGSDADVPTIKIWVNWGRDQVKVLNTLIQESFVRQNNINVVVEQVNASLVQGVISGNSPDLYLQMARTEPVNLAMRGVLYDLKNFDDYEEVLSNFKAGAETPYLYHGGCYALPDTQQFYVMYYRDDILKELGIKLPETWDDFLTATGILQRHNMNTYLPYTKIISATTVNTGAGGLSIFPTLLLQQGGAMYNKELNAVTFDDSDGVKSFKFWTDFYTEYSLDQEANFYQKFRVGTIPLGIAAYTQYLTFSAAAPEIDGKWKISVIPGTVRDDGTIDRSCSGSGTGCAIMKSRKNKQAAWSFLKWWVSAETQYSYSAENEAVLGETGRVASATVKAVERLSWERDSLDVILNQWDSVAEIPEVPGSYFVSRAIDQAFWEVKDGKSSSKEAVRDWAEICNKEIERKIAEYS